MARHFDVWVHSSNTIYKAVPFNVVTDWAQQGRLAGSDKLRTAGREEEWTLVADDPIISDFLFVKPQAGAPAEPSAALALASMDVAWEKPHDDEDDDVDMIPLIDISLVLLIFFMMTSAVTALSPIDVPQMKHAFDTEAAKGAITITIDKRANGDPTWSLRLGDKSPEAGDSDLDSLPALLSRLDERLGQYRDPPEVRIACHRELPSERMHDLVQELQTRKTAGRVGVYRAEVNERK